MARQKKETGKKPVKSEALADNYKVTDILSEEFKDEDGNFKKKLTYMIGDKILGEEIVSV